jgi:AcrR family transcriptional regulator
MQAAVEDGRTRILEAVVQLVGERGYRNVTVAMIVGRAKVSRRTFYEQFRGLQDCFATVLDLGLTLPSTMIVRAFEREQDWREGVRGALAALLVFFDSEPGLTKVWFGEVLTVGGWALEHRERNIATVQSLIVEHWFPAGAPTGDPVLLRGVMTAILGALTTHVVTARPEPMVTLLAPLTRLATAPFLDPETVEVEVARSEALTREILAARGASPQASGAGVRQTAGQRVELPVMLANPSARRARLCVLYLAQHPGASNTEVGAGVGIAHEGQISKLLARLAAIGLLSKRPGAAGRPNAWTLTPEGERVAQAIKEHQRALTLHTEHGSGVTCT